MRQTSIEANNDAKELKELHRVKITNVLRRYKSGTSSQIAQWSQIDYVAVARRMSELVNASIVNGTKTTLCPFKKRNVTLWEISE